MLLDSQGRVFTLLRRAEDMNPPSKMECLLQCPEKLVAREQLVRVVRPSLSVERDVKVEGVLGEGEEKFGDEAELGGDPALTVLDERRDSLLYDKCEEL